MIGRDSNHWKPAIRCWQSVAAVAAPGYAGHPISPRSGAANGLVGGMAGRDRVNLSLRDPDHSPRKTLGWQRDYPEEYRLAREPDGNLAALPGFDPATIRNALSPTIVYQDISHWFVFAGFACL